MTRMLKPRWILMATIGGILAGTMPAAGSTPCLDYRTMQIAPAGALDLADGANDVAVDGHHVLLAGTDGVRILDITVPGSPRELGILPGAGSGSGVALAGNLAAASRSDSQLVFFDIENPQAPTLLSSLDLDGQIRHIDMHDGRILVVTFTSSGRLYLIDARDPHDPILEATLEFPDRTVDVVSDADHAFVSLSEGGVGIVDLQTPGALQLVGHIPTEVGVHGLDLADGRLYVTEVWAGLRIFDIADPRHPLLLGTLPVAEPLDVAVAGSWALVGRAPDVFLLVDVAVPAQPRIMGSFPGPGVGCRAAAGTDLLLVADYHQGLRLVEPGREHSQPSTPFLELDDPFTDGVRDGDLATIRKSNGASLALLDLSGDAITSLGDVPLSSPTESVLLAGDRLFTTDENRQLNTYSVADPDRPLLLGTAAGVLDAKLMAERQGFLLVGRPSHPLTVLDMSTPSAPTEVASPLTHPGSQVCSWALAGDLIWVKVFGGEIYCFDITDPAQPRLLSMVTAEAHGGHLATSGNVLFLASWDGGLEVFDYQAPAAPEFLNRWPALATEASAIVFDQGHLYLACTYSGIRCLDVNDPTSPRDLGTFVTRDYADTLLLGPENSAHPLLTLGRQTIEAIPRQCSATSYTDGAPQPAAGLAIAVYPNPFNPRCTLQMAIDDPDVLNVVIYDLAGHRVQTLAAQRPFEAGRHQLVWNGIDDEGRSVPSGQYIALIMGNRVRGGQKLMLLR